LRCDAAVILVDCGPAIAHGNEPDVEAMIDSRRKLLQRGERRLRTRGIFQP
jgi:hypothetical protein